MECLNLGTINLIPRILYNDEINQFCWNFHRELIEYPHAYDYWRKWYSIHWNLLIGMGDYYEKYY